MEKLTKDEAGYVRHEGPNGKHCAGCQHFEVIAPEHCERVEGLIEAGHYCDYFLRKSRMAEAMRGASHGE